MFWHVIYEEFKGRNIRSSDGKHVSFKQERDK